MKKKPLSPTQVRIDDDLSDEIDLMRSNFGFKISRTAFIGSIIRAGIPVIKQLHGPKINDLSDTQPDSTFKK